VRISAGFIVTLASSWALFAARSGVALLLAMAIATTRSIDPATFAGVLGMFAVTDGVISTIIWLRERRLTMSAIVGVVGVVTGLGAMLGSESARTLLLLVATRALLTGAVECAYAQAMRTLGASGRSPAARPQRSTALWLLLAGAVSAAIGLGFGVVSLLGYDALDLRYCIAGQLGIVGALLLTYSLKLRALGARPTQGFDPRARPLH
jgi:uncharacterized membrane protein HdeD (DUF308 family)